MSDNTIIQQGYFTSTGLVQTIPLRSGIDWMRIYNWSVANASQTTAVGVEYYWQAGMGNSGLVYLKSNATNAANLTETLPNGSFTYFDSSVINYGAIKATITAISTAAIPVVTNSGSNGLVANQVVRILNQAGSPQLGGIDYTVGNATLSSSTFSLDYANQLTVAGTAGSWMLINSSPIFYPSSRYASIMVSSGSQTLVTLTVSHTYKVGQTVRFNVGPAYGAWSALNGVLATVVSSYQGYPNNDILVDFDSSSFGAFVSPLAASVPFTPAQVVPVGENTSVAESNNVSIINDATINTAFIGMNLEAGLSFPAGSSGNLMYWIAGKSFSNNGM